nr:redoxin family protein [uncultured Carboxylicivirga sp.]
MKIVLKGLVAFAIVLAGYVSISWYTDGDDFVKVGDKVPTFELQSVSSDISTANLEGKVVLINFFATWCPPCVKELPHLQNDIWNKYKDNKDFVLLVVGREHSQADLDKFASSKELNLPFYPDPERAVFGKFAKQSIPRNYVIDKKGNIIYSSVGYNEKEFNKLKAVLKEQLK